MQSGEGQEHLHTINTCVTNITMNTTIRNIDEKTYRALKARAALSGKTMGEMINEAIQTYLARTELLPKRGSLRDLAPESYPKGNERLSEEIDAIVYGT
jgi:plasmid stability protein